MARHSPKTEVGRPVYANSRPAAMDGITRQLGEDYPSERSALSEAAPPPHPNTVAASKQGSALYR
jgi:hypothetical protein